MPQDQTIQDAILQALNSGSSVNLTYADLLNSVPVAQQSQPVVYVSVDAIAPTDGQIQDLSQLAGLMGGGNVAALVPNGILPKTALTLQSVHYTLFTSTQTIGALSFSVGFGSASAPQTWVIAQIGSSPLCVTLEKITFDFADPAHPVASGRVMVFGSVTIGEVDLEVQIGFPDFNFAIVEPRSVQTSIAGFFDLFGLPKADFLTDLVLADFQLYAQPSDYSFETSARLETWDSKPLPLLTVSGTTLLAFDSMTFSFAHAPGNTQAQIGGAITILDHLVVTSLAQLDLSSGDWSFYGAIDIPASWLNFHPGQPFPAVPAGQSAPVLTVSLADLATLFGGGNAPPSALKDFGIAQLDFTYQHGASSGNSYLLTGVFDTQWSLSQGLEADVWVTLGTNSNSLKAEFSLDGVVFTLGYQLDQSGAQYQASITEGDDLSLSGTYDEAKHLVSLTFQKALHFDRLLDWLIGAITGNRYFTLPSPWDDAFSRLAIPSGTGLTIDTQSHAISCSVTAASGTHLVSFLGFDIDAVTIGYDPKAKAAGGSGLSLKITSNLPPEITTGTWDPGTQSPPDVPGSPASRLDLRLLGAGQHITFQTTPDSVSTAITALSTALQPANWTNGYFPAKTMMFDAQSGWLIGAQAILLGQVNLQFIFNDPELYGLSLVVTKSTAKSNSPPALDALQGLSAEILYRKVNDTVGVYSGRLTLPDQIRTIDLGGASITLPQFALDIYTNGDFKIDVGFPYNHDFSRSCSVTAGEYGGAGGVYYAKLDGLDPSELPHVDPQIGIFNPVTEIGVGLEVGVEKGFSSGPLSASLSVMLQGIFQGVFAKYTQYSTGAHDEYYQVQASVAIVGHLSGSIDFVIISASVDVLLKIEADLALTAYRKTEASISVSVSVRVTVSINCGLFTIHIHCSFSTSISTSATFGQDSQGLWEQNSLLAQNRFALFAAPLATAPSKIIWQALQDTNPLTVYFIPQLTAGDPAKGGKGQWIYVGQLALSNASCAPAGSGTPINTDDSYAHFIRGLLRWTLLSYVNSSQPQPSGSTPSGNQPISALDVGNLLALLADHAQAPSADDIRAQFKAGFQTTIMQPALPSGTQSGSLALGFFPLIPGMTVSMLADGVAIAPDQPASQSLAQIRPLRAAQTAGLKASPVPDTVTSHLLVDFVMLAIKTGLQKMLDSQVLPPSGSSSPIDTVLAALDDAMLSDISGMTSRFMLHGSQLPKQSDPSGTVYPLYAWTGQQMRLNATQIGATSLSMSLAADASLSLADWGISFAGGGTSLTVSNKDASGSLFPTIAAGTNPTYSPQNLSVDWILPADISDTPFTLTTAIAQVNGPGLWHLPSGLTGHLASGGTDAFAAYQDTGSGAAPAKVDATYLLCVDFRIRRVMVTDQAQAALANTYEIQTIDTEGLAAIETILQAKAAGTTSAFALSLAYADPQVVISPVNQSTSRQAVIEPIDFIDIFLVQSNFSTESRPPVATMMLMAASIDPTASIYTFLSKFWTAGITNSGGYFLYAAANQGLPDALFDASGVATLTLVVDLAAQASQTAIAIPAYANAVRLPGNPVGKSTGRIYIASDTVQSVRPLLPAGHVGISVSRDLPPSGPSADDSASLSSLYHLITVSDLSVGGTKRPATVPPEVFGPLDADGTSGSAASGPWHYRKIVSLVGDGDNLGPLPDPALDPYQSIGQTLSLGLDWTDIFGNVWGPVADPAPTTRLDYNDPLIPLSQLPYLSLSYLVVPDLAGSIALQFAFAPPSYNANDGARRLADIAAYNTACYQLAAGRVMISLQSSLVPDPATGLPADLVVDCNALIKTILEPVRAALVNAQPGGAAPAAPSLSPILIMLPMSNVTQNKALIFPLSMVMLMRRADTGTVPQWDQSNVFRVSFDIAPQTASSGTDSHSLTNFVTHFESVFAGMGWKLATVAGRVSSGSATLKVVRYGANGLNLTLGTPANFAPKPLSNVLLSRSVDVQKLQDDGTLVADAPVNAVDLDLDAQMKTFLASVDAMFSADYAIPISLIAPDCINSLAQSKKQIVEQLVGYVTDLATGESYNDSATVDPSSLLAGAADRYRQECLIRLGAFYAMDAVAVYPLTTGFNGASVPGLAVSGRPVSQQGQAGDAEFIVAAGKAGLSTSASPIAFGIYAKHTSDFDSYKATPSFRIDAIEENIETLTLEGTAYRAGSWLRFITPQPDLAMPPLDVPIPLRAFPEPPHLVRQYASQLIDTRDPGADAATLLSLAKSWSLNGIYDHAHAAQDRLSVDVTLNIGLNSPQALLFGAPQPDLLDALIAFNHVAPSFEAFFAAHQLTTIRTPDAAQKATLLATALGSFASLVQTLATVTWVLKPSANSERGLMGLAASPVGLAQRATTYIVEDGYGTQHLTDAWQSKVSIDLLSGSSPVGVIPQLDIAGYKTSLVQQASGSAVYAYPSLTQGGQALDAATAITIPARQVSVLPLNIIDRQNGLLAMMIRRNAQLPASFHYETPLVAYPEMVSPLLDSAVEIDVSGLPGPAGGPAAPRSLTDHFTALFNLLLQGTDTATAFPGSFQAVFYFEYPLANQTAPGFNLPWVNLPMGLRLPTDVECGQPITTPPAYVDAIAKALNDWLSANALSSKTKQAMWASGKVRIDLSLFSSLSASGQPILRLRNLTIPCARIL